MLPPILPFLHEIFWFSAFAGFAFLIWRASSRFDLRLALPKIRWPLAGDAVAAGSTWFTTTARSSGNIAFDEWRDGELDRIETERQALQARLLAFEAFADKLRRAKDRETFERFMAQLRESPTGVAVDHLDQQIGSAEGSQAAALRV